MRRVQAAALFLVAGLVGCQEQVVTPELSDDLAPNFAVVKTTADVHPILPGPVPDFGTDVGDSRINRTGNGVSAQVKTTGLTPGYTYTLWAVVFNDGNPNQAPDAVRFIAGTVANRKGAATLSGRLNANDGGGELFGELTDPVGAEIHLIVRCHGPKDPAHMPDQINSFAGGCTAGSSGGLGDGPYECEDVQVAIHPGVV